jgi:hypothetical protein
VVEGFDADRVDPAAPDASKSAAAYSPVAEREQALAELPLVEAGSAVGDDCLEGTATPGRRIIIAVLRVLRRAPQVAGARNVGQDGTDAASIADAGKPSRA